MTWIGEEGWIKRVVCFLVSQMQAMQREEIEEEGVQKRCLRATM